MPAPARGIQGFYWYNDKRGSGKWGLGFGPFGGYVFCMCSAGRARGGSGEGEEKGVFALVERIAETKWELWRGHRERWKGRGGRRHEILLFGGRGKVDSKEGRHGGAR